MKQFLYGTREDVHIGHNRMIIAGVHVGHKRMISEVVPVWHKRRPL